MKKILTIIIIALLFTACGCDKQKIDSTASEPQISEENYNAKEFVGDGSYEHPYVLEPREFPFSIYDLRSVTENCNLYNNITYYVSISGQYLFTRTPTELTVECLVLPDGHSRHANLYGEHFIVIETNGEIWYIDKNRKWSCFNYFKHNYRTIAYPQIDECYSEDIVEDFDDDIKDYYFQHAYSTSGRIGIPTLRGTLLCYEDGRLILQRYYYLMEEYKLPFPIKEIAFIDECSYPADNVYVKYAAVLQNNTVVTITIQNDHISVHVVHNGTDKNVRLLLPSEEKDIIAIERYGDAVFFYIDDILHISDGEWDIIVDELPWSNVEIGATLGPGKDAGMLGKILLESEAPDDYDLEDELKNTGITYGIR